MEDTAGDGPLDADLPAPPPDQRRLVLAGLGCATATLGVLFNSGLVELRLVRLGSLAGTDDFSHLRGYTATAALIAGLLVLRLWPSRGWTGLLLAGTVLALPLPLSAMDPRMFDGLPAGLVTVAVVASTPLVLLGVLGAAGWTAALRRTGGGSLAGAAIALPAMGVMVILVSALGTPRVDLGWLLVTFGWLGVLGAAGTVVVARRVAGASVPPPPARLTWCAALAALLPLVLVLLNAADVARLFDERPDSFGGFRYYRLVVGLVMVVPALALALAAGRRVLFAAIAAGLVGTALGSTGVFLLAEVNVDPPVILLAALAGTALGWVAGLTRWRSWFAVTGLAACAIAVLAAPDEPRPTPGAAALASVLLIIGVAAAVAGIATAAALLSEPGQFAPVLGVIVGTVQMGGGYLVVFAVTRRPSSEALAAAAAASGTVLLLAVLALAAAALWLRQNPATASPDDPTGSAPEHDTPVDEAVWYRLPEDA